ncbi:oligosaccharide flippase family protein [Vibrio lentus]|uniref:oligosaccharide flippase family protein n=1 Tax=Vibrio lentus TaxID=136468 RepID=UPI00247948D1|nr:oligosaccharide flippase family protein [Vibrio lentus]WGS60773.1 oligosaccharide flippase family protein [Vibrio lentus]
MSLSNAKIYLFGEVASKLIPFILLPYLTNTLSKEHFGTVTLFQTYYNLFAIFFMIGIDTLTLRYRYRYGNRGIYSIRMIFEIWIGFILSVAILVKINNGALFIDGLIAGAMYGLFNFYLSIEQAIDNPKNYIIKQVSNSVLSTIITILLFVVFVSDYKYRFYAVVISLAMCILFFRPRLQRRTRLRKSGLEKLIKFILFSGSFLVLHRLSFFVKGQLDRILVAKNFSLEDLAIFGLAAQVAMAASLVIVGINRAYTPYIFSLCKTNSSSAACVTMKHIKFSLLLVPIPSVIIYLTPETVYEYIFGNGYGHLGFYLSLLLISQTVQIPYVIMSAIAQYEGKFKKLSYIVTLFSLLYGLVCLYVTNNRYDLVYLCIISAVFSIFQNLVIYYLAYKPVINKWLKND